jgi:soluble cytochrome b562
MGEFAQIPQIQQTVGVADVPPRYARTAPQIPAPEAKGEAQVGEGLGKLADILAVQYQHKQILDADTVSNGVRKGLTQALVDVKQLPGDQQADAFKQKSNDILQAALTDPQNAHIAGYLQSELPKMGAQYADEALRAGASQTMVDHHNQVTINGKTAANIAGPNFVIKPDGTFANNAQADAVEQNHLGMIQALYGKNPNTANALIANYNQDKSLNRAQAIARNPDPSNPGALDSFLNQNSGRFTASEVGALQRVSDMAVREPIRQSETAHALARAQTVTKLDGMMNAHDPGLVQAATEAYHDGMISQQEGRIYTHGKIFDDSAPGVVDFWKDRITNDPNSVSAADIQAIDPNTINGPDRNRLIAWRTDTLEAAKKPLKASYDQAQQAIRDMFPKSFMSDDFTHRTQNMSEALGDLKTAWDAGEFKTPSDVQKQVEAIRRRYAPASKPVPHVPLPSTITREQALRAAERARSVNFVITPAGDESAGGM